MGYVYYVDEKESGPAEEKIIDMTNAPQSFELFKKTFSAVTWESDGGSIEACNLGAFELKS